MRTRLLSVGVTLLFVAFASPAFATTVQPNPYGDALVARAVRITSPGAIGVLAGTNICNRFDTVAETYAVVLENWGYRAYGQPNLPVAIAWELSERYGYQDGVFYPVVHTVYADYPQTFDWDMSRPVSDPVTWHDLRLAQSSPSRADRFVCSLDGTLVREKWFPHYSGCQAKTLLEADYPSLAAYPYLGWFRDWRLQAANGNWYYITSTWPVLRETSAYGDYGFVFDRTYYAWHGER